MRANKLQGRRATEARKINFITLERLSYAELIELGARHQKEFIEYQSRKKFKRKI